MQDKPVYVVMLMSAQKNIVISFFAQSKDDSISREQAYETIEMMYKDIEFHLGEKDYVSGNTFLVGQNSEICFYQDNTFKFYKSQDDHENNYYEGTYDVLYGQAAIDKVVSLEDYGVTREQLESVLLKQMQGNVPIRRSNMMDFIITERNEQEEDGETRYKVCRDTFYAIVLHNKNLVTSPSKSEKMNHDTLYFGQYFYELQALDLANANAASYASWKFMKATE